MSQSRRNVAGVGGTAAFATLVVEAVRMLLGLALREKQQPQHGRIAVMSKDEITTSKQTTEDDDKRAAASDAMPAVPVSPELVVPSCPFAWAVYWDLENVALPRGVSGDTVVHALQQRLCELKPSSAVVRIVAAGNVLRLHAVLRNQLQANGVTLVHVETRGRKDASDKALIAELCLLTVEHKPPFGVALLSGDGDFSYALARMRHLGYQTVVIASNKAIMCSALLESVAHVVWGLREDVLGANVQEQNALVKRGSGEVATLRRRVESLSREVQEFRKGKRAKGRGKVVAGAVDPRNGVQKKHVPRREQQQYVHRAAQGLAVGEDAVPAAAAPVVLGRSEDVCDERNTLIHNHVQPEQGRDFQILLVTILKWLHVHFWDLVWGFVFLVGAIALRRLGLLSTDLSVPQLRDVLISVLLLLLLLMYLSERAWFFDTQPATDVDVAISNMGESRSRQQDS